MGNLPWRSSWRQVEDPEDSSCDVNVNVDESVDELVVVRVAQSPGEDHLPLRHPCDTCNAALPDALRDDAEKYLQVTKTRKIG